MGNCLPGKERKPQVYQNENNQGTSVAISALDGAASVEAPAEEERRTKSIKDEPETAVRCGLRGKMTQHKKKDVFNDYESISVLGVGTMGSVTLVKKKSIGGSARSPPRKMSTPTLTPDAFVLDAASSSVVSNAQTRHVHFHTRIPSDFHYEILYALKTIHLNRVQDAKFIQELRNEIDILKSLDHPNIIRAIETFEYKGQICFLMDLCTGGDLYTRDPYSEEQSRRIVKKLTSAIEYMHRHGVVHRDLKYENILFETLEPDAEIKLIDFGLSKKYSAESPRLYESVGTIYTIAPEVLEGEYTAQADLWSLGVIAYMLLSSELPFPGSSGQEIAEKIIRNDYNYNGVAWETNSKDSRNFISALLVKNPDERITAEKALRCPWLDADYKKEDVKIDNVIKYQIRSSLKRFANYGKLKRLALMVIAHKSTPKEIGSLRDAFEKFDVNRTGTVTLAGFKKVITSAGHTDDEIELLFKDIDADGSGLIDYSEFCSKMQKVGHSEDDIYRIFHSVDLDGNGFIDYEEFREALGNIGYSDEEVERIFKSIDLDGSGCIEYTEFLAATLEAHCVIVEERLAEAFDQIDTCDSGYITKENLKDILQQGFLGRNLTDDYLHEIIEEVDLSRDGLISYEEFLSLWDVHEGRGKIKSRASILASVT